MSKRLTAVWLGSLAYLASVASPEARAQTAKPPEAYSSTYTNAMFGPDVTMKVDRDGSQGVVETTYGPKPDGTAGDHMRTYYDLQKHQTYGMALNFPTPNCNRANFGGDWGDPFEMSAGLMQDIVKANPKTTGSETVNGFATKVMEAELAGAGKVKVWVDTKYGLVIKAQLADKTIIEIKQLSLAKPAASVFALPAVCSSAPPPPPPPPTEAERITAATGGNAADFANATTAPQSSNSCTVLFRPVQAVTMQPIGAGFQLAIDTTVDPDHFPQYHTDIGAPGKSTFSGGALRDVTPQLRNGVYRLDNAPPNFYIEAVFDNGGTTSTVIHRACSSAQTVLLLVIKNLAQLGDGVDYLWVKSGKFAAGN